MELTEQAIWILSAVELNICIKLLGRNDWRDFPVSYSAHSLNRRILDNFLHLTQVGLVEPMGSGYRVAEAMKKRLAPAVCPEQVAVVSDKTMQWARIYIRGDSAVCIEWLANDMRSCRVAALPRSKASAALEKLLYSKTASDEGVPTLYLEVWNGAGSQSKRFSISCTHNVWVAMDDDRESTVCSQSLFGSLFSGGEKQ